MSKHKKEKLLFSGEPPLKLHTAKAIQKMIETALETSLTDEQVRLFQKHLVLEWQEGKKARREINRAEKLAEDFGLQFQNVPQEKKAIVWREFGRQLYVEAEKQGQNDPIGQLIIKLYRAKQVLLVDGTPPLSKQAAESYTEMVTFIHNVINNTMVYLTEEEKEEIINDLVKNFSSYPIEQKESISQADALWGQIRYSWKTASEQEKENFKTQMKVYLPKQPSKEMIPEPEQALSVSNHQDKEKAQMENPDKVEQVTSDDNINNSKLSSSKLSPAAKTLPPKFFNMVNQLRLKLSNSTLIPNKKSE